MSFGIMGGWFNCNALYRQLFPSRQVQLWSRHKNLPLFSHTRNVDSSQRFLSSKKQDFHSHNVNEMLPRLVWNDHSVIVRNMSTLKKVNPQSHEATKPYSSQELQEFQEFITQHKKVFKSPPFDDSHGKRDPFLKPPPQYETVFKSRTVNFSSDKIKNISIMWSIPILCFSGLTSAALVFVKYGLPAFGPGYQIDEIGPSNDFPVKILQLSYFVLTLGLIISVMRLKYYHVSEILVHKNKTSACIRYVDEIGYKKCRYADLQFWPQKMHRGRTYSKFKLSRGWIKRYKIANEDLKYISDKRTLQKFLGKIPKT